MYMCIYHKVLHTHIMYVRSLQLVEDSLQLSAAERAWSAAEGAWSAAEGAWQPVTVPRPTRHLPRQRTALTHTFRRGAWRLLSRIFCGGGTALDACICC